MNRKKNAEGGNAIREMINLLRATPGEIRHPDENRQYVSRYLESWGNEAAMEKPQSGMRLIDTLRTEEGVLPREFLFHPDGRFVVRVGEAEDRLSIRFGKEGFVLRKKDGEQEAMTLTEAKLDPTVVEAAAIATAATTGPFDLFGSVLMDGSDKACRQNAVRFKTLDDDKDWFYFWAAMYGQDGKRSSRLLKASADLDCEDELGVCFEQWQIKRGWLVPSRRKHVRGLGEEVVAEAEIQTVEELSSEAFNEAFGD